VLELLEPPSLETRTTSLQVGRTSKPAFCGNAHPLYRTPPVFCGGLFEGHWLVGVNYLRFTLMRGAVILLGLAVRS
jgi:hypothetical protein